MSLTIQLRRRERGLRSERGVALVEFALILPLLLILALGIVDLGKAWGYKNDMTNLANQAARYAAVNSFAGQPMGPNAIEQAMRLAAPNELATGTGSIQTPGFSITFTFPEGANEHCVGDSVQVIVTATYNWLGFLSINHALPASSNVQSKATMRLEKDYVVGGTNSYTPTPAATGTCP